MSKALLYSFRRCPYAMRARMALDASGVDYQHREVLLRDKPPSMLDYSPKGTVPIFMTKSGEVVDESLAIMRWVLAQNDPENWLSGDSTALIARNDGPFKSALDRYKYASRYDETAKRGDVDLDQRALAEDIIADYEARLSETPFLTGDKPVLADIAIFPFMRQFAATQRDWWADAPYPATRAWLNNWLNDARFKRIMKKHDLWSDADA